MKKPTKTESIISHFPIREDKTYSLEVHVGAVCVRQGADGVSSEILIAKRTATRELFPNKWECGGGQIRPGESFEEAIQRQMYEEFNLSVEVYSIIGTYIIPRTRANQQKIPGLSFLCLVKGKGTEATINEREHSELRWITPAEIERYEFIGGVAKDIQKVLIILSPPPSKPTRQMGFRH